MTGNAYALQAPNRTARHGTGFSLLVTLLWLYIEILRLLAKLASRRDELGAKRGHWF